MQTNYNLEGYYQLLRQQQESQLFFSALRLNIFSYLHNPVTSDELAETLTCSRDQLEVYLLALSECGWLRKQGIYYLNSEQTAEYLTDSSPYNMRQTLLFRESMTSLAGLEKRLGNTTTGTPGCNYDFAALARAVIPEMYATGRIEAFLTAVKQLFPDPGKPLRVLDLGGGSGLLAIEFTKAFPASHAVVFEDPDVCRVTLDIINEYQAGNQVSVQAGDFNTDGIGEGYDFIIASGILDFTLGDISRFMQKIAAALNNQAYLLLIGRFNNRDGYPAEHILSWLSGYLSGVKPPARDDVDAALKLAGMEPVRQVESGRFQGILYQKQKGLQHES